MEVKVGVEWNFHCLYSEGLKCIFPRQVISGHRGILKFRNNTVLMTNVQLVCGLGFLRRDEKATVV